MRDLGSIGDHRYITSMERRLWNIAEARRMRCGYKSAVISQRPEYLIKRPDFVRMAGMLLARVVGMSLADVEIQQIQSVNARLWQYVNFSFN